MNKFKKVDGTNGKQSEFFGIVYEIFESMGEMLELPISKFKNTKNGAFKMELLALVVTVILDYYSSFDISSFIRRNYLVGYIYPATRSVFIFLFTILKFKITYRIVNIFFNKDDWRQDEKYNVLLLVMLRAATSTAIYPFGAYIVIVEVFVVLMFFAGLNIKNFKFEKLPYIIVTFISLCIGLRFVRLFIYNMVVDWIEATNTVFL